MVYIEIRVYENVELHGKKVSYQHWCEIPQSVSIVTDT